MMRRERWAKDCDSDGDDGDDGGDSVVMMEVFGVMRLFDGVVMAMDDRF